MTADSTSTSSADAAAADPMARNGRRCSARSKTTGGQCRQLAMNGGTVCYVHGGRAPQTRAKAATRVRDAKASKLLGSLDLSGAPSKVDAVPELAKLTAEVVALKDQILERLALVDATDALGSPELAAAERSLDRAANVLSGVVRLGLDAELVAIEAAQAQLFADALRGILADLGVLDRPETPGIVAAHVARVNAAVIPTTERHHP